MKNHNSLSGRFRYTACIVLLYIIGKNIPVPWVQQEAVVAEAGGMNYFISQMLGSDIGINSVLTLGMMPWMSASVAMHIFTSLFGRRGRQRTSSRVSFYRTMIFALIVAVINAFVRSRDMTYVPWQLFGADLPQALLRAMTIAVWTAGAFITIWLTERNGKWGIGGMSFLVLINMLYSMRGMLIRAIGSIYTYSTGQDPSITLTRSFLALGIIAVSILVSTFLKSAEFRIPVVRIMITQQHPDSNYIAISLNPAGTMPTVYCMSFFSLPYMLLALVNMFVPNHPVILYWMKVMDLGTIPGILIFAAMFAVLTVSLALIIVNPGEIAERLQRTGDYIDGMDPGRQTERLLRKKIGVACFVSILGMGTMIIVPLILRVVLGSNQSIFNLPITMTLMSSIILEIFEELRTRRDLEQYQPFL